MRWSHLGWTKARAAELALALSALLGALALNNWLGRFASRAGESAHASPDLLLSLLPVVDLRWVFVWGFAAFVAWAFVMGLWRENRRLARIAWLYALLIILRSLFIILTPMRLPEGALVVSGDPLFEAVGRHLTFHNDLFFSSHTALPFLGYLIYRDWWVRQVFLGLSLLLAATVLLTRVHYSIDVFGAYFITYALYRFEQRHLRAAYRRLRLKVFGRLGA